MDRALAAREYASHLTDADLRLLAPAARGAAGGDGAWLRGDPAALHARRAVIGAQREELLRWRDAGHLPDASLRILERELDHEERTLPPGH